jgi:cytoskeleton protein RodZ
MSDDPDKQANGEVTPVAGERLAKARRAREISIQEMAKDLHLDEPKVLALEQNDFEALGAPVFAKGYLRKYAELVGVPEDDVIADYYRLNRSAVAPPLVTRRARPAGEFRAGLWIGGIVAFLLVVLGAAWWLTSGSGWFAERRGARVEAPAAANDPETRDAVAEPVVDEPEAATEEPSESAGPAIAEPDTTAGATGGERLQETVARTAPVPPAVLVAEGDLVLRLAFRGDCWTEVTDANGQRLYFGLGTSGDEVTVSGEPPLNVLLGSSENVSVFVDGAAYPIPASARRGETARLTLTPR